jgi:glycosyltransferase involved in cell wall biosynthesis
MTNTTKLLKIAIYISELDVVGGTHKQVLRLAQYLSSAGHDVVIFTNCYKPDKTYVEFKNIRISHIGINLNKSKSKIISIIYGLGNQLALFFRSKNYDIVNVHDNRGVFFLLLHKFIANNKIIWQINDLDPSFHIGTAKNYRGKLDWLRKYFARVAGKVANEITVNVTKNAERVASKFNRLATVVYCGVDHNPIRKVKPDFSNDIRVVSTGVLFRYRNYETLISSAAIYKEQFHRNIIIDIVGDINHDVIYYEELIKLSSKLNVSVNFRGAISQSELVSVYENAHIFAFLNMDQSWGLAVFEAASTGLPVLLSESVGAIELLSNIDGVIVVNPRSESQISNAINSIMFNEHQYDYFSKNVAAAVTNMNWDDMYSKRIEQKMRDLCK